VESVEKLEYDLTSALVKVSTERRTVGIATAGGVSVPEDFRGLQQILRDQFTVRPVDVVQGPVPDDVTSLIVIDDDAFTDLALYRIDRFVMQGGKVLFLAGGVDVTMNTLMARNRQVKVGPLLRDYGVEVRSALVADAQAPMVGFDVGTIFPLSLRYPWFPQVVESGLSRDNPVTSGLQSLVLPWTSPLGTVPVDTVSGASVSAEVLARSSERSFAANSPYSLNPQQRITPPDTWEPQDLVVALTGRFPSHWRGGKPVPGDSLGTAGPGPDVSPETQMIVVGSSSMATSRFLQQFNGNAIFLANAVDWMTLGSDLIAIRSRGQAARPLREIEDSKRSLLKGLALFPVPILVILFGLVRAQVRRGRRNRYALEFGGKR
jgi:ABC-2 type transport system permease protein